MMRVAYPGAFIAMVAEGLFRSEQSVFAAGLLLLVAAKALKWWAILSLGRSWTFRVIVVPGSMRVRTGPYRFLSHPNYLAVVGELVAAALMTGARVTGPIATLAFTALIMWRIGVERRALRACR
jgi:methyltransferase